MMSEDYNNKTVAQRAFDVSKKAAALGFDWNTAADVLDKLDEELAEIREAVVNQMPFEHVQEEVGDLFFALVNFNRKMGINSDDAFLGGVVKFERRFAALESIVNQSGRSVQELSAEELEAVWQRVKKEECDGR